MSLESSRGIPGLPRVNPGSNQRQENMMEDFDRRSVRCHHGNLLYECPDPEHSTPVTRVSGTSTEVKTIYRYHGVATLGTNITDRGSDMFGGSAIEYVTCPHDHRTLEEAEKCGYRLGVREARRRNMTRQG